MLQGFHTAGVIEAGCDEAGRGCLAGPVFAAAVILPEGFQHPLLRDSKKMTAPMREEANALIREIAVSWATDMLIRKKSTASISSTRPFWLCTGPFPS